MRHVGAGTCRHRNEGTTFVKSRGSAEVEPLYRHVDAGTRGTEMQVLQACSRRHRRPVSCEARGCKQRRHGNEANTGTGMLLLEARVSTLWMYKSVVAEACVRMLG